MDPLLAYLLRGELSPDQSEARKIRNPHRVYSPLIIYAIRKAFSALQLRSPPTSPELELLCPKGEGHPLRISDPSSRFEPPVASVSWTSTSS
ncbi:hypothetical protein Taro_046117 [Colocasia esculenta]|uniref:Uncharacterized protein n=1 Tax=Colocasia esculenta TaxID=4460 RepID=A0A843WY91_COLES|nr:hypothetical protein [Colocasia esculenta]